MDQEQSLKDILETVHCLRDHAVSKEDAKAFATKADLERFATKVDVHEIVNAAVSQAKLDIMMTLDVLVALHKKLDEERMAMQVNFDRLAGEVRRFASHMHFQLQGV